MKKTVDVALPVGPMHPCWKEPVRLKCEMKGEHVLACEVELGYAKKGIERIMRGRPWQEVMFLAERICGICTVIHNYVFIETVEEISDITVPERAEYLRVIVNELDRIQSHLLANFSYCYTIEHETLGMYLLSIRETALDQLELITGARITCAYMIPGGVRFDLSGEDAITLQEGLSAIETETMRYRGMFETGPMIGLRSKGVGILTTEDAKIVGAVGPTGRASNVPFDVRSGHPVYQRLGFEPVVYDTCDNWGRIMARFDEVLQSCALIRTCLLKMKPGSIRGGGAIKGGEAVHSGEAPRGELRYYLKTDEHGRVIDISIRTPSIPNIEASGHYMIPGVSSAADVTSSFISCDPCVSCCER